MPVPPESPTAKPLVDVRKVIALRFELPEGALTGNQVRPLFAEYATIPFAPRRKLIEFAEDALLLVGWNARPGVADVNPQLVAATAATDDHAAVRRVAHRVGHQIQQHPFEQDEIAAHPCVA